MASSRSRHDAADRVAKAACDGFYASSFASWSSSKRKRLSQEKIDSETTARQFENATFNCRIGSPSSTPSHPISITCNREERSEGWKLCVEAAVQMSDDVEARFAAVRVSCQWGPHPVSFGTVHKFLCERDQPTRCAHDFEVCVLGRNLWRLRGHKGIPPRIALPPRVRKKSSVPDSPANKCRSSEKATAHGFAVGDKKNPLPSTFVHRLEAVPKSPQLSASVRGWAPSLPATILLFWLRSLLVRRSTFHLWRSWAMVQLRPWPSIAALSYALPLERALQVMQRMRRDPWPTHSRFGTGRSNVCGSTVNVETPSPAICTRLPLCCSRWRRSGLRGAWPCQGSFQRELEMWVVCSVAQGDVFSWFRCVVW